MSIVIHAAWCARYKDDDADCDCGTHERYLASKRRVRMEKIDALAAMARDGRKVLMVGDGLNDGPALAAASVGFAMAGGADVATEAAGVTLMRGDPRLVADAFDVSRRTYAKIKQGLFWAFAYNVLGIPLAALGLPERIVRGGVGIHRLVQGSVSRIFVCFGHGH